MGAAILDFCTPHIAPHPYCTPHNAPPHNAPPTLCPTHFAPHPYCTPHIAPHPHCLFVLLLCTFHWKQTDDIITFGARTSQRMRTSTASLVVQIAAASIKVFFSLGVKRARFNSAKSKWRGKVCRIIYFVRQVQRQHYLQTMRVISTKQIHDS